MTRSKIGAMEREPLSKYVAYRRKEVGLSQKELSALLSYTPQAISRFEALNSAFPLEFADGLCQALGCSLDDIFLRNRENVAYAPLPFPIAELGALLKQIRERLNQKQEDIAQACSVSVRSLRNYELGRSGPSLQFLESLCLYWNIKPSEIPQLAKQEEQPVVPPVITKPFYSRPAFIVGMSLFAVAIITTGVLVPLLWKKAEPSPNPSTSIVSSNSTIGKYGLEYVEGAPNFLRMSYERNSFSYIGDTITLILEDAYDGRTFPLKDNLKIEGLPGVGSFKFSYEVINDTQVALTLVSARNGEGTSLNIFIGRYQYNNMGFFYYREATPVYLPSDTDHKFPITGGKVVCDEKSEITVRLSDTRFAQYSLMLFNGGMAHVFEEGVEPSFMGGDGYLVFSRSSLHNWAITIGSDYHGGYVEIPAQIEQDTVMVTEWVEVVGETENYWYALDPLVIHIIE